MVMGGADDSTRVRCHRCGAERALLMFNILKCQSVTCPLYDPSAEEWVAIQKRTEDERRRAAGAGDTFPGGYP